jgi:DNA-binding SARP family transcriptional activator/tetratricopeptide (TPR) repeat protein
MSYHSPPGQSSNPSAAGLDLYLLGPPRVEWEGHALPLSRRQVRALLYRLAAEGHPLPREQLCYLFWPDVPEATARRNLTGLLAHIRRTMPVPDILLTQNDHVGLDPDRTWVDTAAFRQQVAAQGALSSSASLQEAADLYQGPFLDGFSLPRNPELESWITLERQRCERLYLEVLAALMDRKAATGEYDDAIAFGRRYLATDALAEGIHRRLIELYVTTGDRSRALRQFGRCTEILDRELGVAPLPETVAVYRTALNGKPATAVVEPVVRPAWTPLPARGVSLVGRDREMHELEEAFARASSGRGSVVLISGEPGIGKSRLMQEFASRVRNQAFVLVGMSSQDTQTVPYHPVAEALRPALRAQLPWLQAPACSMAEAARLIPDLRLLRLELPPPLTVGPEEARTGLFEALCQLTLALAAGPQPAILCLDDLHWADDTTLDWLAHLGRRLWNSRLLIIGTYSGEESSAVAGMRHGLAQPGILSELGLARLDESAILEIARHLGDTVPNDQASAHELSQMTGGNPFFLLQILWALHESSCSLEDVAGSADACLPDTIRDAVETRVAHLSSRARQVLEACSVLGRHFGFELVHVTAGRRQMETMDGLDELVARQLLSEEVEEYRFRHEVVRSAVYGSLGHSRRRLLHRRAAEALGSMRPTDVVALARHFDRAGQLEQATKYALLAGQEARAIYGHAEARTHLNRALALLAQRAADLREPREIAENQRLQIEALQQRGWVLRLLGEMEAYAHDLQEDAQLAEQLGDARVLAYLHFRQAYTHRWFCRYDQARAAAEEGLRLSRDLGDRPLEARCWREVGLAARESGDYDKAEIGLERALDLGTELGDPAYEVHLLGNLATLHWYLGEYERSLDLGRRALVRCDNAELAFHRRIPLGDIGAAASALGDVDLAQRSLLESLEIARQISDRTQEILCRLHLGWLEIKLGQPTEALEHLEAGLALAEQIGSCTEQSGLHSGLAEAYRLKGDLQEASGHADRALALAQETKRPYDEGLARRTLAKIDG